MGEVRQACREPQDKQNRRLMGLLSFSKREWTEHVVHVVDLSCRGAGVECDEPMEPGLVWFHDGLGEYRTGILLWSRTEEDRCRAGIRFLHLTAEEEHALRNWPPTPGQLRSCSSLERTMAEWMRALAGHD